MTETESVELLRCVVDAPVPSTEGMTSAQAREQRMICGYNKIPAPSMLPPSLCCLIPCLKQSKARRYFDIFVPDTCCVKRNGKWIIIDSLGVVTGDLVKLTSGQHAAADLKIIEISESLFFEPFAITGRPQKIAYRGEDTEIVPGYAGIVHAGVRCVEGECKGVVVYVGENTLIGKMISDRKWPP